MYVNERLEFREFLTLIFDVDLSYCLFRKIRLPGILLLRSIFNKNLSKKLDKVEQRRRTLLITRPCWYRCGCRRSNPAEWPAVKMASYTLTSNKWRDVSVKLYFAMCAKDWEEDIGMPRLATYRLTFGL